MVRKFSLLFLLIIGPALANGQLILNEDLGTLAVGSSLTFSGTSVGAGDEAAYYGVEFTNPLGNWGEDYVYQFTTETAGTYRIQTNAVTGDPDFFLLDSLDVENDGFKDFASGTLQADFLDEPPPASSSRFNLTAGTYYISVDSWHGGDDNIVPLDSTWDATITLADPLETSCLNAFTLDDGFYDRADITGNPDSPYGVQEFTVDETGEYDINATWDGFDGFLYLFDTPFAGFDTNAIASDDDFNGTDASQIDSITLNAGQSYYLLGTTFDPMPGVTDLATLKTTIVGPGVATAVGVAINGDFDNNGAYECSDIDGLVAAIAAGSNDPAFDLTGDGVVDGGDRDAWLGEAATANGLASAYRPGDANLDGTVDVSDFNIWNSNKLTSVAAWCSGDFNADGSVDVSDFNLWNQNKFTSSDAHPSSEKLGSNVNQVPEPSSFVMLAVGLLAFFRRSRR